NIVDVPETDQYISTTSAISYSTNSLYNYGPISEIEIIDKGKNYQKLPRVINVNSLDGRDSLLELETTNIGSIESLNIKNYGFDYSADLTLEPKIVYPTILKVSTLYTIDSIGVTSAGFGYNTAPDLLVFDGLSKEIVEDISLSYDIINQKVDIIENTSGISKIPPQIIPINNSNGIGVTGSYFDPVTKVVTLELSPEFSDPEDFPFEVGGRVLVEGMNVDVGTSTTIKGYNSENYGFALFTIVSLDDNLGGAGATISYSMEDYLEDGDVPGEYDPFTSNGVVIPEKFFPTFDVKLKDTEFFEGETVKSGNSVGKVEYWDSSNSYLSVSSKDNFEIGKLIVGQSSKTKSIIEEEFKTYGFCEVKAFSIVDRGWNTEKGFLNNQFQRVHDSDYYQYFSYAVKSEVSLDRWNDPVSNLNHTAGFKKFSDLVVRREQNTGFRTDQNEGAFTAV
ncbi:hypothetical protein EB169_11395, partial [archaeon]|nr:hypothetical protein [archaeon]